MVRFSFTANPIELETLAAVDLHYEQIGCLGHGGFASVFLAKKRSSGRKVAIKFFHMDVISKEDIRINPPTNSRRRGSDRYRASDQGDGPDADADADDTQAHVDVPESFTRELEYVKKLRDQSNQNRGLLSRRDDRDLSVVFFEQAFSGKNFAGIVMNYCDGGTLAQAIEHKFSRAGDNSIPYTERRIAWYALQLSEALAFSHERGVYHHDVKSSNVLINWSSGGTLLLSDFGSAIGSGEESFGMSEVYASPELQAAYAIANNNNDSDEPVRVEQPDKIDSFGLGCIVFELLCCRKLVDLTGEQTLAEFIADNDVEAALDLNCVQLPWLPNPHLDDPDPDPDPDEKQPADVPRIGYSFALRSLVKTLLEPDPSKRWTVSELQKPLRKDPSSPLLANLVVASESLVPGDPVTVDNVQLGMFVQYSRDWEPDSPDVVPFRKTPVPDSGFNQQEYFQSITAMPENANFDNLSFEELRLRHYMERDAARDGGECGVVVGLDPDAQYAQVIFSSATGPSKLKCSTARIGASRKFELHIGPPLEDFFAADERTKHTGLLSAKTLSRKLGKESPSELSVGQSLSSNCILVAIDLEWDLAIVVPTEKFRLEAPTVPVQPLMFPCFPAAPSVENRKPQPPPEYWETNGNVLVEEDDVRQRDIVTELFFSDGGGMDIQAYEIVSIKRVQSVELWSSYSQSCVKVAAENWGVCNEHRLFLGTGEKNPEQLLNDPPSFFYHNFHSDGVMVSNSPSYGHVHRYQGTDSDDIQIVLSRVALGKIDERARTSSISQTFHSKRRQFGEGVLCISDTSQAYPEYIITYKPLQGGPSQRTASGRYNDMSRFGTVQSTRSSFQSPHSSYTPSNTYMTTPAAGFMASTTHYQDTVSFVPPAMFYPPATVYPPARTASNYGFHTTRVPGYYSPGVHHGRRTSEYQSPMHSNVNGSNGGFSFGATTFDTVRNDGVVTTSNTAGNSQPLSSPPNPSNGGFSFGSHSAGGGGFSFGATTSATASNGQPLPSPPNPSNAGSSSCPDKIAPKSQKPSAEKEKKPKSSTKQCVVCLERDVRRIVLPCGHPCLCEVCSTEQGLRKLRRKCPECRGAIKEAVTIFARVVDD